jgi:hypothetical protein
LSSLDKADSKIPEGYRSIPSEQDIRRLNIAVKNTCVVRDVQSVNDRQEVSYYSANVSAVFDSSAVECSALAILTDIVGWILIDATFNYFQNIRVLEFGGGFSFLLETPLPFRAIRVFQSLLNEQLFLLGIISLNKKDFALAARCQTAYPFPFFNDSLLGHFE